MSARSHNRVVRRKKRNPRLADSKKLARLNPDLLARNLLRWRNKFKNNQQRRELWRMLRDLGGAATVKRAVATLARTRSAEELEAVAHAAAADQWFEVEPALCRRFHREVKKLASRPAPRAWEVFRALGFAAVKLESKLAAADLRALLRHSSSRLRTIAAEIAALQQRRELLDDLLPLCWESGEAANFAGALVARLGTALHAATLWTKLLQARKRNRRETVRRLLDVLAPLGAFDIQVALRVWIEEDFADPAACAWHYGAVWSQLTAAKLSAGECEREEALADLRWFLDAAGSDCTRGFGGYGAEQGPFHVAQLLVRLGEPAEAEALLTRFAACGVPAPEAFPELLLAGLRDKLPRQANSAGLAWLAAGGDAQAQAALEESWRKAVSEKRRPEHWGVRRFLNPETVLDILREGLRSKEPAVLRHTLSLIQTDRIAGLEQEIEELARRHSCAVIRWKARRVLKSAHSQPPPPSGAEPPRWVRLDAAILSGALRPDRLPGARDEKRPALRPGVLPPDQSGHGFRLDIEGLSAAERHATCEAVLHAPLHHALHRTVPLGPAFEDRPDVRAVRELAAPGNEIDERMADLAAAVMSFWSDDDEVLTLDEEGIALVATGLCTDVRVMDDDDVLACGAFVGEALRKRLGGQWTGFDDRYMLEIQGEIYDPMGWAAEIHAKHDPEAGARTLLLRFHEVLGKFVTARWRRHPDPSAAFQQSILKLCALSVQAPMTELLAEARVMSYRLEPVEWPLVFSAIDALVTPECTPAARAVAALSVYAPTDAFGHAWAKWGRQRRERSGLVAALAEAMGAAVLRDDLEAMPDWTASPAQSRFSFLNTLRKQMDEDAWRGVLLLLLRQRAAAADRDGVAWCLYSYKYEFPDVLNLLKVFCEMSVSARQTVLRATFHSTQDERKLFRPLWAESLRDPSLAVVLTALSAVHMQRAKSLRPLVQSLLKDKRADISATATELLRIWNA